MIGIGYQGLPLADLIEQLRADDVKVLVDVRLNAISRKVGYSKRELATALEAADIRYLHDLAWGTRGRTVPGIPTQLRLTASRPVTDLKRFSKPEQARRASAT